MYSNWLVMLHCCSTAQKRQVKGGRHTWIEDAQTSQNFHGDLNFRHVFLILIMCQVKTNKIMCQMIKTILSIFVLDTVVLSLDKCFYQQELVYDLLTNNVMKYFQMSELGLWCMINDKQVSKTVSIASRVFRLTLFFFPVPKSFYVPYVLLGAFCIDFGRSRLHV